MPLITVIGHRGGGLGLACSIEWLLLLLLLLLNRSD